MDYSKPDGTARTAEQWRAAVAEKVMGWKLDATGEWRDSSGGETGYVNYHQEGFLPCFAPDESAEHDLLGLEHVRETWSGYRQCRMRGLVRCMWNRRFDRIIRTTRREYIGGPTQYERGDWSVAALGVVERD